MEDYECVKKKLKMLEVDIESLKPYLGNHLLKIEKEIEDRRDKRSKAEKCIYQNNYDVKTISEATGISRTTFYNYDCILQRYVELSHKEDYKEDPYMQVRKLRETIKTLQEEKALMVQRDCRELRIKAENEKLKQQIVERDKTINNLRKRIMGK